MPNHHGRPRILVATLVVLLAAGTVALAPPASPAPAPVVPGDFSTSFEPCTVKFFGLRPGESFAEVSEYLTTVSGAPS